MRDSHIENIALCVERIAELKKADEVDRTISITLNITKMMYASIKHDCGIMKLSINEGIRKVLIEEFGSE